ncbi:hypothetical protein O3P69_001542 [Scylla paramamosain]|uniref:Uncharacterized protein n=1 Tax=Scylla paramamosain TaxID=85552 RepID=A0AAW0UY26_SCYPA
MSAASDLRGTLPTRKRACLRRAPPITVNQSYPSANPAALKIIFRVIMAGQAAALPSSAINNTTRQDAQTNYILRNNPSFPHLSSITSTRQPGTALLEHTSPPRASTHSSYGVCSLSRHSADPLLPAPEDPPRPPGRTSTPATPITPHSTAPHLWVTTKQFCVCASYSNGSDAFPPRVQVGSVSHACQHFRWYLPSSRPQLGVDASRCPPLASRGESGAAGGVELGGAAGEGGREGRVKQQDITPAKYLVICD